MSEFDGKIPPPTDDDLSIDPVRFYRYLSGDLDEYGGPHGEDIPSSRAMIRRMVAAEAKAAGFEKALAELYEVLAERSKNDSPVIRG